MGIKFVIACAPRVGSTLLVRTLNRLDGLCCHGELLNGPIVRGIEDDFDELAATRQQRDDRAHRLLRARNDDPVGFIQSALSTRHQAAGFKALYEAILNPRWKGVVDSLLSTPNLRFIHLTRDNSLRRYISERVVLEGGPIHSGLGGRSENPVKVSVDIDAYLRRAAEIEEEARRLGELLANQEVLNVSYKELATDAPATVAKVCQFLGFDPGDARIAPALRKVGAMDLDNAVMNYQDLLNNEATRAMALTE